jgi:hypothetical protein
MKTPLQKLDALEWGQNKDHYYMFSNHIKILDF